MKESDSGRSQPLFVVAIFAPQVDNCANAVLARKFVGAVTRDRPSDRQIVGKPMKIGLPAVSLAAHAIFFIFLMNIIIFNINILALLLFFDDYCCFCSHYRNNKAS